MAGLAAEYLSVSGVGRLIIANRTRATAEKLIHKLGGETIDFATIGEALRKTDLTICSISSNDFVISQEMIQQQAYKSDDPIFLIDLGLPRNIDPQISNIPNLSLYNLDDLKASTTASSFEREESIEKAKLIIIDELDKFEQLLEISKIGPRLGSLRKKMQDTARKELFKQRTGLGELSFEQEQAIENLLISTVNKIAHPILYGLQRSHNQYGETQLTGLLDTFLNN
jgi:glutamyl-tRNA reductase